MPVESLPATAATIAVGDLYVVSGCSGSGKSTLIAALAEQGEAVSYEPGRQIVQEQMNVGGDGLPWKNLQRLKHLCAASAIGGNSCPLNIAPDTTATAMVSVLSKEGRSSSARRLTIGSRGTLLLRWRSPEPKR